MTNELLARISILEYENIKLRQENERLQHSLREEQELNEYLQDKINKLNNYIEKMSYCDIVDNPKKELSRILEKGD